MPKKYATLEARLQANTRIIKRGYRTPCYEWTGRLNNSGYGMISRRDPNDKEKVMSLSVHKVAFVEVHNRTLRTGHEVSHLCDNEACWRGDHLKGESHKANMGRQSR